MDEKVKSIILKIEDLLIKQEYLLIAIDGRCGSGKTTLAENLKNEIDCNIIPMDHFFLRPEQRNEKRMKEPGGNVDYERFYTDVLIPLKRNTPFSYTRFDCNKQKMSQPIDIEPKRVNIIEGVYSCHPKFFSFYDYRIFLHIDEFEQKKRIIKRNGESVYNIFKDKWIPPEELYFKTYGIKEKCDAIFTL